MPITYLTTLEVAQELNVTPAFGRKQIIAGKLRAFRFGGVWRISRSAMDDYLERSLSPPVAAS